MYLIGLDIGTTGCKAALFTDEGELLGDAFREYTVTMPHPTWVEQDAELVWSLAQESLQEVLTKTNIREVAAIGLSVQGESCIPVDKDGKMVRPAIQGMDYRTTAQNEWLRETFGAEALFEHTGMPIHTVYTLPKILWIKEHEPHVWEKTAYFLLYEDFIINKMTGENIISRCLASRSQLYDIQNDTWSAKILGKIGLDVSRLSRVQESGEVVAPMRKDLADKLGFAKPPLIVNGGHDQACGALGVGLTRSGVATVSTGTAEVMEVAMPEPTLNNTLYQGDISVYAHTVPDLYVAMTLNHCGGLMLRWFRDTFCQAEIAQAKAEGSDAYDLILKDVGPEPSSLLMLPHFAGKGTPTFDAESKGAILGMSIGTTRTDIAKAILDGLTYELRLNTDLLKEGGIHIDELRAIGGGARSKLWVQLKADITGIPVVVPKVTEAACWGAALLAGKGAGCYADVREASDNSVQLVQRYEPDPERHQRYNEQYTRYQQVYPAVAPISHQLD